MPQPAAVQELIRRHPLLCLIGNTPLVPVPLFQRELPNVDVLVKCEFLNPGGSVKDRSVLRMLSEAVVSGALPPEKIILDSSSGNAGIAYAMIGAILGRRVELVVPENASEERKKRIQAHGATLVLTASCGWAMMRRCVKYAVALRQTRNAISSQTSTVTTRTGKHTTDTTAEEILAQTGGQLDWFVAGVGTGGTITGVRRAA